MFQPCAKGHLELWLSCLQAMNWYQILFVNIKLAIPKWEMEVQDGAHSYFWEICGNFRTSAQYHVAMHNLEIQIVAY